VLRVQVTIAAADCRWKYTSKDRQTRKDHPHDSGWSDGHGVMAIMREVGVSKTTVWRWQEYLADAAGRLDVFQ
jgi:hypothetical protein